MAKVEMSEWNAVSIMSATPAETVKSILGRIHIEFEEGLPKESYLIALYDDMCEYPMKMLTIFPEEMIHFLLEVWEHDEVDMDNVRWNYMEYIRLFGILTYRRESDQETIYVIREMKERFYFLFKSKKSHALMERNSRWERIICGFMYFYGFIDTKILHEMFLRVSSSLVGYEEFLDFLMARCSFWAFGSVMKDIYGRKAYFQYHTVKNTELLVLYLQQHKDIPYKKLKLDDLLYLSEGTGLDNRWPGMQDLALLLYNESFLDYYQGTVMIRTLVDMTQNGRDYEFISGELEKVHFHTKEAGEKALKAFQTLYEHIPVFEYKGHSRKEFKEMFHEREIKKRQRAFTILEGGKRV